TKRSRSELATTIGRADVRTRRAPVVASIGLVCVAAAGQAEAGFVGRVVDGDGRPVAGAVVSARFRPLARTTSVYADAEGRFAFPDLAAGTYDLRARHFGFRDANVMGHELAGGELQLRMEAETDEYDRLAALPSNRWLAL